jgi:hypothetical protein
MQQSPGPRHRIDFDVSVTSEVVPTAALTASAWNEIWQLTRAFFETDRDYAESKLKEHQRVALFRSRTERALVGMASIDVYPITFENRRLAVIYTTHVLLYEEYRGHNLLQRLGLKTYLATRLRFPLRPIYWFFETFSYKGYLLLPRNFRHFWPHHERRTPPRERALIDHLATRTYGADWRSHQGIVVRSGKRRLKPDAAPLERNVPLTPELKFFSATNPGHAEGDMLICLCPLTASNWLTLSIRAFERMRKPY